MLAHRFAGERMTETPTICPWCSGRSAVKRSGSVLTCQECGGSSLAPDPVFPTSSCLFFGGGVQSTTLFHPVLRGLSFLQDTTTDDQGTINECGGGCEL